MPDTSTCKYNSLKNKTFRLESGHMLLSVFERELKKWCKRTGKTQEEFSEIIGKPIYWANKVLQGQWKIAVDDLEWIIPTFSDDVYLKAVLNRINRNRNKIQEARSIRKIAELD